MRNGRSGRKKYNDAVKPSVLVKNRTLMQTVNCSPNGSRCIIRDPVIFLVHSYLQRLISVNFMCMSKELCCKYDCKL